MNDYNKDLKIDPNNLTGEWLEQPTKNMTYSELYADAAYKRDTLKTKLELTAAIIDSEIRKDFQSFGFDTKPTEVGIKNTILMDTRYKKAQRKALKAGKQANLMTGAKTSFEHRKKALENLVTLVVTGMHSEPKNKNKALDKLKNQELARLHKKTKKVLKEGKRNHMIGTKSKKKK